MNILFVKQNPAIFQGNFKKRHYFEGWYFKIVDIQHDVILAIIPGISITSSLEDSHAFIQILDGKTAEYSYLTYPLEQFQFSKKTFEIHIADNFFSSKFLKINVKQDDLSLNGVLHFKNLQKLPFNKTTPGVMSYFSYFPSMDCYHGIVSMNHSINGTLIYNDKKIDINHQKGYIEKDWGKSFPKKWIWMQGNHFCEKNRSFMFSLAQIEYFGLKFLGFLGILFDRGQFYRFGTYNLDKCKIIRLSNTEIELTIQNRNFFIRITASKDSFSTGLMKAPNKGFMTAKCAETINAHIKIQFFKRISQNTKFNDNYEKDFSDETHWAGLEIMGSKDDFHKLMREKAE